jgi:hypothetical protein
MFAKTVDRRGHLGLKRLATHFAIGEDLQAGLLLERNGLIHGPVFGPLLLRPRTRLAGSALPCESDTIWFYNNLQDRGDCQSSRKSYKTSSSLGWIVG